MASHPGTAEHARWLAYTSLVCAQAVRANANRSVREPIHRLPPNPFLLLMAVAVVAIQAAIPSIPFLAEAFHATPLDASDWVIVFVIALVPAVIAETVRTVTGRTWVA
jgi:Ca2+-transporting ATPase